MAATYEIEPPDALWDRNLKRRAVFEQPKIPASGFEIESPAGNDAFEVEPPDTAFEIEPPEKTMPIMDKVKLYGKAANIVRGKIGEGIQDMVGMKPGITDLTAPLLPLEKGIKKAIDIGSSATGVDSKQFWLKNLPRGVGYGEGAVQLAEGLSTPENLGIMWAFSALPTKLKNLPKVANLIKAAASGQFAYMMSKDLPEVYDQWKAAEDSGDKRTAARLQAIGFGQLAMAALTAAHAGKSAREAAIPGQKPIRNRVATTEESAIAGDLLLERPPIGPERQLPPPTTPGSPGSVVRVPPNAPLPPSRQLTGPVALDAETTRLLERLTGKPIDQVRKEFVAQELKRAAGIRAAEAPNPVEPEPLRETTRDISEIKGDVAAGEPGYRMPVNTGEGTGQFAEHSGWMGIPSSRTCRLRLS